MLYYNHRDRCLVEARPDNAYDMINHRRYKHTKVVGHEWYVEDVYGDCLERWKVCQTRYFYKGLF